MAPLNPEQFRIAGVDYVLDTSKAARQLGWQPQQRDADMLWSAYDHYIRQSGSNGHSRENQPT